MKPGDLRIFRDFRITGYSDGINQVSGRPFVVLKIINQGNCHRVPAMVSILVDGSVKELWDYSWVRDSSEVIDETG
jgi:hypothetical protein